MKNTLIALMATAVVLQSCTAMKSTKQKEEKTMTVSGTKWQLADATGTALPTLIFTDGGKIVGNASCNNYNASAELSSGGNFSVQNIASTRMTCKNIDTEINFLNMLRKANRYKVTAKRLELYQNEILLLKFNRMP